MCSSDLDLLYALGECLSRLGRPAEALEAFDSAIAVAPEARSWFGRALALEDLSQLDAARAAFTSGAGDLLRLVDAERVYADARLAVNDLTINAVLATIEARLALAEDAIP